MRVGGRGRVGVVEVVELVVVMVSVVSVVVVVVVVVVVMIRCFCLSVMALEVALVAVWNWGGGERCFC